MVMRPPGALVLVLCALCGRAAAATTPQPQLQHEPPADNKDGGQPLGRARAINFTAMADESGNVSLADVDSNGHPEATTLRAKPKAVGLGAGGVMGPGERRLDDVSMDDDDNMDPSSGISMHPVLNSSSTTKTDTTTPSTTTTTTVSSSTSSTPPSTTALPTCLDTDGKVYVEGQRFSKACDQVCTCAGGRISCTQRCSAPFLRRGSPAARADPLCVEKDSDDPCCVLLVCAHDSSTEPQRPEKCSYKNSTYSIGQTFTEACESVCNCGDTGRVTCKPKPKCPPTEAKLSDRCVAVPDTSDPCCTVVLCDVTLGDHEVGKPATGPEDHALSRLELNSADAINSTAVRISGDIPANASVEASLDARVWMRQEVKQDGKENVIAGLIPGRTYFIRLRVGADMGNAVEVSLPASTPPAATTPASSTPVAPAPTNSTATTEGKCSYKGKSYSLDEEFHDGCQAFCACTASGMQCAPLECPTDFGLDLLDPECLDWETVPRDFVAQPPHCCPEKVSCRNNGSCEYAGQRYPNYSEIPPRVTGCEQRCYCEYGNVTCEAVCPPVPPAPPRDLPCPPHQAVLAHQPGDTCCLFWMCPRPVAPHFHHPGNQSASGPGEQGEHPPTADHPEDDAAPSPPPLPSPSAPLVLAPTPTSSSSSPALAPSRDRQPSGPIGVLAPTPIPPANEVPDNPLPGPFVVAPTSKPSTPPRIIGAPGPGAFPGPFAPTPSPDSSPGKHHKGHTHYIGPFRIDDDDNNDEDPAIHEGRPPGLHKDPDPKLKPQIPKGENTLTGAPSKPSKHPGPAPVVHPDYDDDDQGYGIVDGHQVHPGQLPYFPGLLRPQDHIPISKDGVPGQKQPFGRPENNPEYQIIPVAVVPPGPPHGAPAGGPPQRRPSPEELLYLQGLQQPQGPPGADVFLLHNQQGNKVYHVLPHGGAPPGLHEQIIAHIREQEAQEQQQQRPKGPPLPHSGPPHGQLPVPIPYPIPPHPHGQGLGLEHGDDLATDTSRHPAHQQQLAQLLSNHSYAGFPEDGLPTGFHHHPGVGRPADVTVQTLDAVNDTTVRLVFSVPQLLVGLHGRVELRYTSDVQNDEPSTWEQQVLAPPGDLIATPQLEFELSGLHPDTVYKIKITVILRDLQNTPSSEILSIRTPPTPTTQPPEIPVDPELTVAEVNATWARLSWRKATPFELQFIDGVQLRYKEIEGKVYAATPLIHRAVTSYTLEGLRPDTQYEVGIYFIPFPGQNTELQAERTVSFTTGIENDPYKFELTLDVHHIKSTSVELSWQGVPYPEDKFVNIFRAIYQSDAGKEDFSSFKIAKRDSPPRTIIQDLKPGTRYRLWLEAYLTNGRIKKSNVQDFITKPGSTPTAAGSTQQGKLEGTRLAEVSDYYGPLVAVAIIATLAILTSLALLLLLLKKCAQSKAAISTCRKSQSAYDNPSYKTSENDNGTNGHVRTSREALQEA